MNVEDIELKFVKYRITKFQLIIPGYDDPYMVDEAHIGNWTIEKDYENYLFPYLEFRCIVPDKVYSDIMENSENVYVDLKIEYGLFEDMYEMNPNSIESSLYGTVFDTRFYAFIDNQSPKLTDSSAGEVAKANLDTEKDKYSQYSYDNNKSLVMGLYRADHIFHCNTIVNTVLSKATVTDAISYYFKKIGIGDVLMSPTDNSVTFDQLILAPLPASKGILRTVNTYGLHKAGTIVFFDYDKVYIIDKKLGATAWVNNEIKTVYLTSFPTRADQATMKSGFYTNEKEKYSVINIVGNSISITNEAMFDDQLVGGNVLSIDSNTGEITKLNSEISVSDLSTSKTGAVNRIIIQNEGTNNTERTKTAIEQSQKTMAITVQDTNITAFAPNKDYIFTTDNSNYKDYAGHYRITSAAFTFTKESTMYTCMCNATFVGGQATI